MTEFNKKCPICGSPAKQHIYLGRSCFCSDECKQKWIHNELSKPGVRLGFTSPLFKYVMAECSKRDSDSCFDRCAMCGKLFIHGVDDDREYHHIIPLDIGGNNLPENIVILCRNCHDLVHSFSELHPDFIKPTKTFSNIEDIVNECLVISDWRGEIFECSLWFIVSESTPHTINYRIVVHGVDTDKKHYFDYVHTRLKFVYKHSSYCNILDVNGKYSINECKQIFNLFERVVNLSQHNTSYVVFDSEVCEVDSNFIGCVDNWINDLNKYSGKEYFARWGIKPKILEGA